MGKKISLNIANQGLIPGILSDPQSWSEEILKHRARGKHWA